MMDFILDLLRQTETIIPFSISVGAGVLNGINSYHGINYLNGSKTRIIFINCKKKIKQ